MTSHHETALLHGDAILEDRILEDAVVVCREGKVDYIGRSKRKVSKSAHVIDLHGGFVGPGYVDLHVHGGAGSDFMDGTAQAVLEACISHAMHGTTTIFPTTTTGSPLEIARMIAATGQVKKEKKREGARIGGVHLYGPYFASTKVGCHNKQGCRSPISHEYEAYFDSGIIKIATCAAELPGAVEFYRAARKHGCLVTCGHSDASWQEMQNGFAVGLRHVDHFWCAMSNVASVRKRLGVPMQGSMLEFVLAHPEMSTEVIADGWHLAPELLEFAFRMKGPKRLCLVTDANRAVDMPPGRYRFGPSRSGSWFVSDGEVGWANQESLASSVRGMDHMVRIMARDTSASIHEVVRMASLTPAERVGMGKSIGSIAVGKRADLLVLDRSLQVLKTLIDGRVVSQVA